MGVQADGGLLFVNGSDNGGAGIESSISTLEIGGASGSVIEFPGAGSTGTLKLDSPGTFTGTIKFVQPGSVIDLGGVSLSVASYNGSTLTVTETNGQQLSFALSGNLTGDAVSFASDGNGGTDVSWSLPAAVTQSAASPFTGDEGIGKTITITLTLSEPVTVSGVGPTLQLNDGGAAAYASGSGTNTLTFNYTVAGTDSSVADLAITRVTNASSVTNSAGSPADFSAAVTTFTGLQIDTIAPTITQVSATPATGDEGIGKTIQILLTFSKPVTVSNSAPPALTLNDGGSAAYSGGSSTNVLTFTYTVGSGDTNTNALSITAVTNISSITDVAGNTSSSNGAIAAFAGLQVDTIVPAVTAIAASPSSGVEYVGSTVAIALTLSEAVTVSGGTPTLSLNDGGAANFQSLSSDGKTLTFSYTVGPSDTSLPALAVTAFNPNGANIADAVGNSASLSSVSKTFSGLQINTGTPVITGVSASPDLGDIGLGQKVTITVNFSQNVTVKGAPKLTLNDGGSATYSGPVGTPLSALAFTYTVAAGQSTTDLQGTGITLPSGASIKNSSGQAANLSGATVDLGLQIDSTKPTVTAVNASPGSGDLNATKTVAITLTTSEPVVVTGSPTLTLNDGGTTTYTGPTGTSTSALTFSYTVAPDQNVNPLKVNSISIPSGSSILDLAGNSLTTTLPASATLGLQIDTKAPTVTSELASASTTDLNAGKTAEITLLMSEAVTVTGIPTLALNDGGTATYDAALSSATALTFDYTVQAGQNTTALKITGLNPAGSIQDLAANALATIPSTSLGLQANTVTPTVTKVTSTPATGTVTPTTSPVPTITLKMNEAVTVSGTPELLLSNGGTANYDAAASTSTSLVFTYSPTSSQSTSALSVIGLELPSPNAIQDGAGNVAVLSGAAVPLGFKVNAGGAGAPSIVTISGTSEAEIFGASSQNVTFAAGANGALKLDTAQSYTGNISGLTAGDTLDLANIAFGANTTVGFSGSATSGVLTIADATHTAKIALLGRRLVLKTCCGSRRNLA